MLLPPFLLQLYLHSMHDCDKHDLKYSESCVTYLSIVSGGLERCVLP